MQRPPTRCFLLIKCDRGRIDYTYLPPSGRAALYNVEGDEASFDCGGRGVTSLSRRGRGRPRKFAGPSRAVTLTLPESVLSTLASVHEDISKAVVQLTE